MTLALLCPTKGRPQQFKRMVESAQRTADNLLNLYVALSNEDVSKYERPAHSWNLTITPDGLPTCHKWNILAEEAMKNPDNKLFMLAADDVILSTPLYDKALMDAYDNLDNKIHVFALLDSRDPEGTPHPIVTREWIETMGWAFPPIFLHWQLDSWTVAIAKHNNCFTHLKDYLLIHDKPSDKGVQDGTHSRIRSWGWRERDAYVSQSCGYILEYEKQRLAGIIASQKMEAA